MTRGIDTRLGRIAGNGTRSANASSPNVASMPPRRGRRSQTRPRRESGASPRNQKVSDNAPMGPFHRASDHADSRRLMRKPWSDCSSRSGWFAETRDITTEISERDPIQFRCGDTRPPRTSRVSCPARPCPRSCCTGTYAPCTRTTCVSSLWRKLVSPCLHRGQRTRGPTRVHQVPAAKHAPRSGTEIPGGKKRSAKHNAPRPRWQPAPECLRWFLP